jgi:virginiamycin B lyase
MRQRRGRGAATLGVLAIVTLLLLALPGTAGAFLYWTNLGTTTVGRAGTDGSAVNQGFLTGAAAPSGVAANAEFVYWANSGGARISRSRLDGSEVKPNFITGASTPGGVALDSQHIYWTNFGAGTIGRANLDGSEIEQSFITGANNPRGVAVDSGHIYWSNVTTPRISRANLNGTGVESSFITTGVTEPAGIAVDSQHIYWANGESGKIGRANIDGTAPNGEFIVNGPGKDTLGMAVDSEHIYWTNFTTGTIGRASLDGSGVNGAFITGATGPFGVTVDSLPHTSATTVSCTPDPLTLPQVAACTATVSDAGPFTASPGPSSPTGAVTFSTAAGSLTPASSCSLTPSGAGNSSCQLNFDSRGAGDATISAAYPGDGTHSASSGSTTLRVNLQIQPPPPKPSKPSNLFSLRRQKHARKNGTAILTATVPGPGQLRLQGQRVKKLTKNVKAAGEVKLEVQPKPSLAKSLKESGKAKVTTSITYTPTGGEPNTQPVKVVLRLRGHSRRSP